MTTTVELREERFDPLLAAPDLCRRLLDATAQPGVVVEVEDLALTVPPPRLRPACALLLSRMDREVSFHVAGPHAELLRSYLRFHTRAHASALADADFVLLTAPGLSWGDVDGARHGGATVVSVPDRVSNSLAVADVVLRLAVPGVPGERRLAIEGLSLEDLAPLLVPRDTPRQVDVWLAAADGSLAVIPRSTRCR